METLKKLALISLFLLGAGSTRAEDNDGIDQSTDACPNVSALGSVSEIQSDISLFQFCMGIAQLPYITFDIGLSEKFSDTASIELLYWLTDNEQFWITLPKKVSTGRFELTEELNQYAASGSYHVRAVRLLDNNGEELRLNEDQIKLLGFVTEYEFTNINEDNTAPSVSSLVASEWAFTDSGQPTIEFEVTLFDDLSGVKDDVILELNSPTGSSLQVYGAKTGESAFRFSFILNQYVSSGNYVVNTIRIKDNAGNLNHSEAWISNNLSPYTLTNPNSDSTQPSLTYSIIEPQFDELRDHPLIRILGKASDDTSGIQSAYIRLTRPSGGILDKWLEVDIAGNINGEIALPNIFENGLYQIDFVRLIDNAENQIYFDKASIDSANNASTSHFSLFYPNNDETAENTVDGSSSDDYLFGAHKSADILDGQSGDDYLYSGDGDDQVIGGDGDDIVVGGSGRGDDSYDGSDGNDTLIYTSAILPLHIDFGTGVAEGVDIGIDTFLSFEKLTAGQGNDLIITDAESNYIQGFQGDDIIIGSLGNDELAGGDGVDEFIFKNLSEFSMASISTILDYESSETIVLEGSDSVLPIPWDLDLATTVSTIDSVNQIYFATDGVDGYLISVHDLNVIENSFVLKLLNYSQSVVSVSRKTARDNDSDGQYNEFDMDDDNDGVEDRSDAFPFDGDESTDNDIDGVGDNADTDDDNDGYLDTDESNAGSDILDDSSMPDDYDGDFVSDVSDLDDDNDGVEDQSDAFPFNERESIDTDSDGVGNNADTDDDNDGVEDQSDAFPLNESESTDTDSDGVGNNADTDDDNDGFSDSAEISAGTDPLDKDSKPATDNANNNTKDSSSGGGSVDFTVIVLCFVAVRRATKA